MTAPGTRTPSPGRRPARQRAPMTAWVLTPLLLLILSALFVALFSPVISWALGDSSPGIFIAHDLDCHHGCAWFGEFKFIGTGHTKALQNVRYAGNTPAISAGTRIPAAHIHSALFTNLAYPRQPAARDLLWTSVWPVEALALILLLMLVRWAWTVPIRYWRRRNTPPGSSRRRQATPPPWLHGETR